MQPATIRRLLVFGVCLVGVGCLYLVPSMTGSPSQLGSEPRDRPTASVGALASGSTEQGRAGPGTTSAPVGTVTATTTAPTPPTVADVRTSRDPLDDGGDQSHRVTATAADPGRDGTPPGPVGRLRVADADADRLVLSWPASPDDQSSVTYRIWVNGFAVLATQATSASIAWFNDSNTHVIQVRAIDEAGNQSASSPTLMVTRPAPQDSAEPAPGVEGSPSAPTPTTKPSGTPAPSPPRSDDEIPNTSTASPAPGAGSEDDQP